MSGAVISSNTSIKVSAKVLASQTVSGSVLYTVPANSYAVVNISAVPSAGHSVEFRINSITGPIAGTITDTTKDVVQNIHLGPTESLYIVKTGGTFTCYAYGVQFINSP